MTSSRNGRSRTSSPGRVETKTCASCGRTITWRAKWADSWDEIRYCSDACRRRGVTAADREAERVLREALERAPRGAVIDLDTVTPQRDGDADGRGGADERDRMRRAARRLVAGGEADLVQRGRVVDPSTARGPVGVRRSR